MHVVITLTELNSIDRAGFLAVCGPLFEHSPWIAEQTFDAVHTTVERAANDDAKPFASIDVLHAALCHAMYSATQEEQLHLIASHPDLVGRLAGEGRLTHQSTTEQAAAGLNQLSVEEAAAFADYNAAYREKFGFPFVICARENKKNAILAAFPIRLGHTRDREIQVALVEIAKIARLRLLDVVTEG